MNEEVKKYFKYYEGTPRGGVKGNINSSVHHENTYRLDKGKEQITNHCPVSIHNIICYVNRILKKINMSEVNHLSIDYPQKIDYKGIQCKYNLADIRDIVWMKFTNDGYLGVVASSNDINFDIPQKPEDYNIKKSNKWKHNTSGILIHKLNKRWDTSFVLVFPLTGIPKGYKRGDIERAIGNYLISKNVPIIDFYSHNY